MSIVVRVGAKTESERAWPGDKITGLEITSPDSLSLARAALREWANLHRVDYNADTERSTISRWPAEYLASIAPLPNNARRGGQAASYNEALEAACAASAEAGRDTVVVDDPGTAHGLAMAVVRGIRYMCSMQAMGEGVVPSQIIDVVQAEAPVGA